MRKALAIALLALLGGLSLAPAIHAFAPPEKCACGCDASKCTCCRRHRPAGEGEAQWQATNKCGGNCLGKPFSLTVLPAGAPAVRCVGVVPAASFLPLPPESKSTARGVLCRANLHERAPPAILS